jgi:hypothetical protein
MLKFTPLRTPQQIHVRIQDIIDKAGIEDAQNSRDLLKNMALQFCRRTRELKLQPTPQKRSLTKNLKF